MKDYIVRAIAADGQIRAFAATTKNMVEEARTRHNMSPIATTALGRLMTGGAMMGTMMKSDADVLTIQIKGNGPIGQMTVTADAKGSVKGFVADKEYLNKFIVSLAAQWSANESIVISTADAEGLKKYFAANAKALLDKGVRIEEVNGTKSLFTISPADGSYKVKFGEEEFENYFKDFLRPQLVEMLF